MLQSPVPSLHLVQDMLLAPSGYLPSLLHRLDQLVTGLEEDSSQTDYFYLAKTLYFAEMFNNEIDAYTNNWLTNPDIAGLAQWRQTEEFKQAWHNLKRQRDEIYHRLIVAAKKIPLPEIEKWVKRYGDYLTRYLRPTPPVPTPPPTKVSGRKTHSPKPDSARY